jgi:hypothetical protein
MIILRSLVGCHAAITALQISRAKSNSVPVKLSGEYSKVTSIPVAATDFLIHSTPCSAKSIISFFLF